MAGTWVSAGCEGIWGSAGTASRLLPAPRQQPSKAGFYFGLGLASPPRFLFLLTFSFPHESFIGGMQ